MLSSLFSCAIDSLILFAVYILISIKSYSNSSFPFIHSGATHRGNLVVLGNKPGGSKGGMKALGVAAAPTPLNTPSLKRENNGKDLNAVLVPVGSGVWGSKNTEDKQGGEDDSSQQQQQPTNETAEVEATVVVSKPAPWSTKSVETPAAASVPKEDPYKERKSSRLRSWVDEESDDDSPEDEEV